MSSDLFRRYIDIIEGTTPMPGGPGEYPKPRPATRDEIKGTVPMSKSHVLAPDHMVYWWQDPALQKFTKQEWADLKNQLFLLRPQAPTATTAPAAAPAAGSQSVLNRVRTDMANRGVSESGPVALGRKK